MVRESISKMKNEKAAELSVVVLEVVKVAGEASVYMITDLVNLITAEGAILGEWGLL